MLADKKKTIVFQSINLVVVVVVVVVIVVVVVVVVASISLKLSLAIVGNILTCNAPQFKTLNGHLVTKTAREKIGRHFVLADKEKTIVFQDLSR